MTGPGNGKVTGPKNAPAALSIHLDRGGSTPVGEQIFRSLRTAIQGGVLAPGARLPSGRDLAIQLGVARGTVRSAYDRLVDESLIFGAGSAGMRVHSRLPVQPVIAVSAERLLDGPLLPFGRSQPGGVLPFQMGVPSQAGFPFKLWQRMVTNAARANSLHAQAYADPQGEHGLRAQIASHLAVSRQIQCHPDQIVVTSGYRQGLTLALSALQVAGGNAWVEDPGYPLGRKALELAGLSVTPVPVDHEGIRVADGIAKLPNAKIALVTPGQQAPLGMSLSPDRRLALLDWATARNAWIIEDDYLSELQLDGRVAPALASGDGADRIIHIGSFSKTMSPSLGMGFLVCPPSLAGRFIEIASTLCPAPASLMQKAMTEFLGGGHYLRHLRKMKDLYSHQRAQTLEALAESAAMIEASGLALKIKLPAHIDDRQLAIEARKFNIAPVPLSPWYATPENVNPGLLASITNIRAENCQAACGAIAALLTDIESAK